MNLDIQKLKITLNTNVKNSKPIEFIKDVLYHPEHKSFSDIEKYPYITTTQLYPEDYLSKLEYDKIVNIFFNKENFQDMLNENKIITTITDATYISNKNVMIMLRLLFSTKYFIVNNIHQSLDVINKTDSAKSIFYNPFNTKFSYIKINGKPHTITKAVWLNDTVNHPKYNAAVKEVGKVINKYKTRYPDDPEKLRIERNRSATSKVNFNEISYNLRNRILPSLRSPSRESSNNEIQNSINMELNSAPDIAIDKMTKKQLYQFLTDKVLSSAQKEDLKDELLVLEKKISDSSSKDDYIELITKYNKYTDSFYDIFEKLYDRYMLNKKNITIDKKLLDIGIDDINIGMNDNSPEKEIFVMLDLIDGEVNDQNKKEVYCPYTDEYLGNLLNNIVYNTESSKLVKNTKSIYSVDDMKTTKSNITNSDTLTNNPTERMNKNNPTEQTSNNAVNAELFYSQVFNLTENTNIVNKIRPFLVNNNIIDFIKKNQELYAVVSKSLSTTTKTTTFMDQITRLKDRYKSEIGILTERKTDKSQLPINLPNIDNDILKYEFYSTVLDKILAYENKKPMSTSKGGRTQSAKNRKKPKGYKNKTKKNIK